MAQLICDQRDVDFVLHELLEVSKLTKFDKFKTVNKKTIDLLIKECRKIVINEVLPSLQEGDREGCTFDDGKVTVSPSIKKAFEVLRDNGFMSFCADAERGGHGLPHVVSAAADEHISGAGLALVMFFGLSVGVGNTISEIGSDEQKDLFLEKLYTGQWTGTMLITEPQAGTDIIKTETIAKKNTDGTFSLEGNKIFITAGENDLAENIIHLVLAKSEDDKISLFIVPKYWVNESGKMEGFNNVVCTGIEKKMGIKGSPTCSLSLKNARGLLIGKEGDGIKNMFHLMNAARLEVGLFSLAIASSSYLNALEYAKERKQGRNLLDSFNKNAPSVPIIDQPDIRRQLLHMKALVEGMRSLVYYTHLCLDKAAALEDEQRAKKSESVASFLIPLVKAYCTDQALNVCYMGMQVFGGYGYTSDYPQEQLYRDCRITSIYEGTNGIQAIDFMARKLKMNKGKVFMDALNEINKVFKIVDEVPQLSNMSQQLKGAMDKLTKLGYKMSMDSQSVKVFDAFSCATPFLEVTGDFIMGLMLLWRAAVAYKKLESPKVSKKEASFYEGKIKSAEFYFSSLLPVCMGKIDSIKNLSPSVMEIQIDSF